MRLTFREKTLSLAKERLTTDSSRLALSDATGVHYHKICRWIKGTTTSMAVDDVQRVYEYLTGRQLEY